MSPDQCRGATVHPPDRFYPLYGVESLKYFDPDETEEVLDRIKDIMGFHYWNSHTKNTPFSIGSGSAFDSIAKEHCPRVYAELEKFQT